MMTPSSSQITTKSTLVNKMFITINIACQCDRHSFYLSSEGQEFRLGTSIHLLDFSFRGLKISVDFLPKPVPRYQCSVSRCGVMA